MKADDFVSILRSRDVSWFTGVPCSFFQAVYTLLEQSAGDRYVPAANEGAAMAIAAGLEMAGQRTAVLIQNSGLGNLINPLTSLHAPYQLPGLLFVSGRAFGVPDEPQHQLMGRITDKLLEFAGTHVCIMSKGPGEFADQFDRSIRDARPGVRAFIVPKGTIESVPAPELPATALALSRWQVLEAIAARLPADAAVLSTTGMTSREWVAIDDRARSFYSMGSMGHVMSIALGVALGRPRQLTIVLDGDGAALMHLGALSTIGAVAPPRLLHVIVDNGRYESTGNQRTTSASTDLAGIAANCGYRQAVTVDEASTLASVLDMTIHQAVGGAGPILLRVRVAAGGASKAARVTGRLGAPEIAGRFAKFLQSCP